ncbi:MAG: hypothetical protein V9E95_08495 [Methanothrix soehngenii]
MVRLDEIEGNEFNLNIPRYIDSQQAEDIQDIAGHLQGGIPGAMWTRWRATGPSARRCAGDLQRPAPRLPAPDRGQVRYQSHHLRASGVCRVHGPHGEPLRRLAHRAAVTLKALQPGFHPKALIASLGKSLLAHYADKPLIGSYDVYQHLMDYWAAAMQDDCYLVAADGWRAQTARIIERDKRGNERDKGWTCDLVPKALIVARYFAGAGGH